MKQQLLNFFMKLIGNPKCECCGKHEAIEVVLDVPVCLDCLVLTKQYTEKILNTLKEDHWVVEDRKAIEALEKRIFVRRNKN